MCRANVVLHTLNKCAEAIIIAQEKGGLELKTYVHEIYKSKIHVDWHFLPDYMGTAEALLSIKDKIKVRLHDNTRGAESMH